MKTTLTEAQAYQLRTVLNQVLASGFGRINDVEGRKIDGKVKITINEKETK